MIAPVSGKKRYMRDQLALYSRFPTYQRSERTPWTNALSAAATSTRHHRRASSHINASLNQRNLTGRRSSSRISNGLPSGTVLFLGPDSTVLSLPDRPAASEGARTSAT